MHIDDRPVTIPIPKVDLDGDLTLPAPGSPLVVFAHGSGSSRGSPRNRYVAAQLAAAGLGTLLFDLLAPDEARYDEVTARLRFDIPFLAGRMVAVTDWLAAEALTADSALGYFGASTGAAAALVAAAERPERVGAVVSRGGRPDLAGDYLPRVDAPTLLIVGGNDPVVLDLNRSALARMRAPARIEVVPGATHLFEEYGALAQVAALARDWLATHLLTAHVDATRATAA